MNNFYEHLTTLQVIALTIGLFAIMFILLVVAVKWSSRYKRKQRAEKANAAQRLELDNFNETLKGDDQIRIEKLNMINNFIDNKRKELLKNETDNIIIEATLIELDNERNYLLRKHKVDKSVFE